MRDLMLPALMLPALIALCGCSYPSSTPEPATDDGVTREAAQPASASYCVAACSAAASVDCQKMFQQCGYRYSSYVSLGGYVLSCWASMPAACFPYLPQARAKCEGICTGDQSPDQEG